MLRPLVHAAVDAAGYKIVRKGPSPPLPPEHVAILAGEPLAPDSIGQLCRAYDQAGAAQAAVSRDVMGRIAREPAFGELLMGPFARKRSPRHVLWFQIAAAVQFARGRLREAAQLLAEADQSWPSAFNALCLCRALEAVGDPAGEAGLRAGLGRFPGDLYLTMELATCLARSDRPGEADALLQSMRHVFEDERRSLEPLQREIEEAIATDRLTKEASHDIYTEEVVVTTWWRYWRCYEGFGEHQEGNAGLDHAIRRAVKPILQGGEIRTFIDFGAFCAHTIFRLAQEFPAIRFIGIDRPQIARDLNVEAFALPNLEFIAGDVLDLVETAQIGADTALFHARTACFCYPAYLRRLYAASRRRGISHILAAEVTTFSRWFLKLYPQGQFPAISMAARTKTFVHDYRRLIEEAGYTLVGAPSVQPWLLLDDSSGFIADHRIWHGALSRGA